MIKSKYILIITLLLLFPNKSFSETVAVSNLNQASRTGVGYLGRHGSKCFVITPQHVLDESPNLSVNLSNSNRTLLGEKKKSYNAGDDVAIIELIGNVSEKCGKTLSSYTRVLRNDLSGNKSILKVAQRNGKYLSIPVEIIFDTGKFLTLTTIADNNQKLRKGHSGGTLYMNNKPIAQLQSVNAKKSTGTAIKFDEVMKKFDAYIESEKSINKSIQQLPQTNKVQTQKLRVISWSQEAISLDNSAVAAFDGDSNTSWRLIPEKGLVDIELELVSSPTIKSIYIVTQKDTPNSPTYIEVLTSNDKEKWKTVYNKPIKYDGITSSININKTNSRFYTLRLKMKKNELNAINEIIFQ